MIQKKICMVGVHGTGKTSLVQRYVHSMFSSRYHSTVGVKIDRKTVTLAEGVVNLLLWDVEGRSPNEEIPPSYLRGAHGVLYVADGTRRETYDQIFDLRAHAHAAAGIVPGIVALNKADLTEQWVLSPADSAKLTEQGFHVLTTSAKTGDGVEQAFRWLAAATLTASPTNNEHEQVRHGD